MTTSIRTYRAAVIVLLAAVAALGTVTGILATRHTAPAAARTVTVVRTADDVTSYNDGFATSKQDDCQQGFAAACQWSTQN